jgi:hypothetical protein
MFGAPSSIIASALASQNDPFVRHACWSSENVARGGLIDRRIREVTSRPDALCTLVTIDS